MEERDGRGCIARPLVREQQVESSSEAVHCNATDCDH